MLLLVAALPAAAVPFWGAKQSSPADTAPGALKPGEFVWNPVVAPAGPIVVVVSLTEQRAYVYRNGVEIGFTTVSTGKPGHETPTGVFTILQKDKDHRSSKYNNAPMPYQQRLTWDGVALHAGGLPGYPESHGCVHLPSKFAEELFGSSHMGMTVVVVDTRTAPVDVVHPAALAPVDAEHGSRGNPGPPPGRREVALAAGKGAGRPGVDRRQRGRPAGHRASQRCRDRSLARRVHGCGQAHRHARLHRQGWHRLPVKARF